MSTFSITVGLDQDADPDATVTLRIDSTPLADAPLDLAGWAKLQDAVRALFGDEHADRCQALLQQMVDELRARRAAAAETKAQLDARVAGWTDALPS